MNTFASVLLLLLLSGCKSRIGAISSSVQKGPQKEFNVNLGAAKGLGLVDPAESLSVAEVRGLFKPMNPDSVCDSPPWTVPGASGTLFADVGCKLLYKEATVEVGGNQAVLKLNSDDSVSIDGKEWVLRTDSAGNIVITSDLKIVKVVEQNISVSKNSVDVTIEKEVGPICNPENAFAIEVKLPFVYIKPVTLQEGVDLAVEPGTEAKLARNPNLTVDVENARFVADFSDQMKQSDFDSLPFVFLGQRLVAKKTVGDSSSSCSFFPLNLNFSEDDQEQVPPKNCSEWRKAGAQTGVHKLTLGEREFDAYCDMTSDDQGWTLILNGHMDGNPSGYFDMNDSSKGGGGTTQSPTLTKEYKIAVAKGDFAKMGFAEMRVTREDKIRVLSGINRLEGFHEYYYDANDHPGNLIRESDDEAEKLYWMLGNGKYEWGSYDQGLSQGRKEPYFYRKGTQSQNPRWGHFHLIYINIGYHIFDTTAYSINASSKLVQFWLR